MRTNQLIIALFQRFCWLDEGLQARLHDHGWPDVNRPQSMVMTNIVSGVVRPSDIARNLGVSRQAIHSTINQMVKLGMVRLDVDPDDRRHMIVSLTDLGAPGTHVLAEGGPTLNGALAQAGLLDELCVSLSPLLASGDAKRLIAGSALDTLERLRLHSVCEADDYLFLRYRPAF